MKTAIQSIRAILSPLDATQAGRPHPVATANLILIAFILAMLVRMAVS